MADTGGVTSMEWRRSPTLPSYEVSECGDLRLIEERRTRRMGTRPRGYIDHDGYLRYSIHVEPGRKLAFAAHRLVAEAFIGPAPSKDHEVAHNNGSRVSNHFRNLRWALRQENHADMAVHGTGSRGQRNGRAKVTEEEVHEIRRIYPSIKASGGYGKIGALAAQFGVHPATLIDIAKGRTWRHIPMPAQQPVIECVP